MPHIRWAQSSIDDIHLFAMPDVSANLGRCVARAQKAGDDGHACAMDGVREPEPFKKCVPLFRGVSLQFNQGGAARGPGPGNERFQILVQGRGVTAAALYPEPDRGEAIIDVVQRSERFGGPASEPHQDQPMIAHPLRNDLAGKLRFNDALVLDGNLGFSFGGRAMQLHFAAWVANGEPEPDSLAHDYGQEFRLEDGGIVVGRAQPALFGVLTPREVSRGDLVNELARGGNVFGAKIGVKRHPRDLGSNQGQRRGGITFLKERRHPSLPKLITCGARRFKFALSAESGLGKRVAPAINRINGKLGGFPLDLAGKRIAIADPIKRGTRADINGGHWEKRLMCMTVYKRAKIWQALPSFAKECQTMPHNEQCGRFCSRSRHLCKKEALWIECVWRGENRVKAGGWS